MTEERPALVRSLLAAQFPRWAELPIEPVFLAGTDNAVFRLSDGMTVRVPWSPCAAGQAEKEARWLPRLAPALPLLVPLPLALGEPGEGVPWRWPVFRWLPGADASISPSEERAGVAEALGSFVRALRSCDAAGGPVSESHNGGRGLPLTSRDAPVRAAIEALADEIDPGATCAAWNEALAAPCYAGPPS